ncbi:MAG TPA: GntR family transcriptional regulator [Hypericibacter adhaerens]|jgi:GntR family transcriptional regulator|uniref:GntR family transcriptional regulator n=1 Tax=Hypericibacter adhaerens TaxID=2602016 RepID=UPI002C1758C0|nr:GntR family transcriptional regulator [Hypericibacter adhaerens]HWA41876.1 GntR family transcriptional regulator [Hypericibacter adhaerens]
MPRSQLVTAGTLAQVQPRYVTVAETLARQIGEGELKPGAQLLGERELCKRFDVSRVTIRRALAELRDRGLIDSDGARGWFVNQPSLGEPNELMGFSEMARGRGLDPRSVVLVSKARPAEIDEADDLRIAPGSDLFELKRVRKLDGIAVAIECSRIPLRYAPGLVKIDFAAHSLYDALREAGCAPAFAEYVLQAVSTSNEQAPLLGVEPGSPLLMASAVTHDRGGRPIELSHSLFRGDRYRFRTTLYRSRRDA